MGCAAVVYLLPHEASYVDFLRVRKIPLQQAPLAKSLPDIQPTLQRLAETDRQEAAVPVQGTGMHASFQLLDEPNSTSPHRSCRLVMEAGTKAFVSYVRAYKEHHCKFIFRPQVSIGCGLVQWTRLASAVNVAH